MKKKFKIALTAKKTLAVTLLVTGMMAVGHFIIEYFRFTSGRYFNMEIFYSGKYGMQLPAYATAFTQLLFNLECEENIPTLWSLLLLMFSSALLAILSWQLYREKDKYVCYWALLSLAFFYLGMDEWFMLHEKAMGPMHRLMPTQGVLLYSWIIPAGLAVAVMGIIYLKFLFNLPRRTALLFIISGAVYVGAAIGFEMLEGPLESAGNWMGLQYSILVGFEETLEMVGICLFSYAIIDYAARRKSLSEQSKQTVVWKR